MESEFLSILENRAAQIEKEFSARGIKSIDVFVSGGSSSALMLYAFSSAQKRNKIKTPIQAIYIQFNNFIWLEREATRNLSKHLQIPLKEIVLSETSLTLSEHWKSSPVTERETLIRRFVNKNIASLAVVGDWPQYLRIDQELSVPGIEVFPHQAAAENRIVFFTEQMWQEFIKHEKSELFFELWSQIPFPSIRYWQDYVFKDIFPEFQPCMEWKLKNIL